MPVRVCSQWPTLDPELTKLRALACRTLTANMRTLRHAAWLATLLLMDRGQTLQAKRELVAARTLGSWSRGRDNKMYRPGGGLKVR